MRETQEEVGVVVSPQDFHLTHVLDVRKGGSNDKSIYGFYFIAHRWKGEALNNEPEKIADAQWLCPGEVTMDKDGFSPHALPEAITEHALLAMEAIKQSKSYMQSGW